jgi:hypothetical protein
MILAATLLTAGAISPARAAVDDCGKFDAASAATVLGVPKARANPSGGHHKLSPNNMDVIGCSYVEATPDPQARSLIINVYTPIAKDLASQFAGVSNENVPGKPQNFSPGVGSASSGWVRLSANGETYDGTIRVLRASDFLVIKVGGMKSADEAKAALIRAGKLLTTP